MRILVWLVFYYQTKAQDLSALVDISTLSELPLEKLLQVRKTFDIVEDSTGAKPLALALEAKKKTNDRGGYYEDSHHESHKKEGKKNIQSIFQISVTTLAFLAFGGYLLCLLTQAVRGKMDMNVTPAPAIIAAYYRPVTRRRTTRRPIRFQNTRPYNRRRPRPRPKREVFAEDSEDLYFALVNFSEAYTKFHTLDYKHFNSTE